MQRRRHRRRGVIAAAIAIAGCTFDTSGVAGTSSTGAATTSSGSGVDTTSATTVPGTESGSADTTLTDATSSTSTPASTSGADSTDTGGVRGWWDPAWAKRRRIDLALPEGVVGPLQAVPILVLLDDARIPYDELQTRGQDLRFVDADDDTVLAHEIERWDAMGTSAVWVKVPQLEAADDFIYMYWGNADAPSGVDPAELWTPGYAVVYHLDDNPEDDAPQISDSSPSLRDATAQGGMMSSALVDGYATRALEFDGVDDAALMGTLDTNAWTEITVSAWVNHGDEGDDRAISKAFGTGPSDHVFMLGAHGPDVKLRLRTDGDGAASVELRPTGSLPANEWHYLAMTWSAASQKLALYIDGVPVDSADLDGDSLADGTEDVYLANVDAAEDRHWLGVLDEVRVEHTLRDDDWISTQFATMRDDIATFAAEEQAP